MTSILQLMSNKKRDRCEVSDEHNEDIVPYTEEYDYNVNSSPTGSLRKKSYKQYAMIIEKLLKLFESVEEWTDLVSILTRLKKSIRINKQFPVVPHRIQISRLLASCLTKYFPAGVHKKALEVYELIFEESIPAQNIEDIASWSFGLFPFSLISGLAVKSQVLSIYQRHYLNMGPNIACCIRGLFMSILPFIDEEYGESFADAFKLIVDLKNTVGEETFSRCVWLCIISSPHLRIPTLNYVSRALPKKAGPVDNSLVDIKGKRFDQVKMALKLGLSDKSVLVQRKIIDILYENFPIKCSGIDDSDILELLVCALYVLQFRDVSLTRRVRYWIQGKKTDFKVELSKKSSDLVVKAVEIALSELGLSDHLQQTRLWKALTELLTPSFIDDTTYYKILPIVLKFYSNRYFRSDNRYTIVKQMDDLLSNVSKSVFWTFMCDLILQSNNSEEDKLKNLDTILFILQKLTLENLISQEYVKILLSLCLSSAMNFSVGDILFLKIMSACNMLMEIVSFPSSKNLTDKKHKASIRNLEKRIKYHSSTSNSCYKAFDKIGSIELPVSHFSSKLLELVFKIKLESESLSSAHGCSDCSDYSTGKELKTRYVHIFNSSIVSFLQLLISFSQYLKDSQFLLQPCINKNTNGQLLSEFLYKLCVECDFFTAVYSAVRCMHEYFNIMKLGSTPFFGKFIDIDALISKIWTFFFPKNICYSKGAFNMIGMLAGLAPNSRIEWSILSKINKLREEKHPDWIESLAIFLSISETQAPNRNNVFSRVCLAFTEVIVGSNCRDRLKANFFLSAYIKSPLLIVNSIMRIILNPNIRRNIYLCDVYSNKINIFEYEIFENPKLVSYSFDLLSKYIEYIEKSSLYDISDYNSDFFLIGNTKMTKPNPNLTYIELIIITALNYIFSDRNQKSDPNLQNQIDKIHRSALEVLKYIFKDSVFHADSVAMIESIVMFRLFHLVQNNGSFDTITNILEFLSAIQMTCISMDSKKVGSIVDSKEVAFEHLNLFFESQIIDGDLRNMILSYDFDSLNQIFAMCFSKYVCSNKHLESMGTWIDYLYISTTCEQSEISGLQITFIKVLIEAIDEINGKLLLSINKENGLWSAVFPEGHMDVIGIGENLGGQIQEISIMINRFRTILNVIIRTTLLIGCGKLSDDEPPKQNFLSGGNTTKSTTDPEFNLIKYLGLKFSNMASKYFINYMESNQGTEKSSGMMRYMMYKNKPTTPRTSYLLVITYVILEINKTYLILKDKEMQMERIKSKLIDLCGKVTLKPFFSDVEYLLNQLATVNNDIETIVMSLFAINPGILLSNFLETIPIEGENEGSDSKSFYNNYSTSSDSIEKHVEPSIKKLLIIKSIMNISTPHFRYSFISAIIEVIKNALSSTPKPPPVLPIVPKNENTTNEDNTSIRLNLILQNLCCLLKKFDNEEVYKTWGEYLLTAKQAIRRWKMSYKIEHILLLTLLMNITAIYMEKIIGCPDNKWTRSLKEAEGLLPKLAETCSTSIYKILTKIPIGPESTYSSNDLQNSAPKVEYPGQVIDLKSKMPLSRKTDEKLLNAPENFRSEKSFEDDNLLILEGLELLTSVLCYIDRSQFINQKSGPTFQAVANFLVIPFMKADSYNDSQTYTKFLDIVLEILKNKFAQKSWKTLITEKVFSPNFFRAKPDVIIKWTIVANAILNDKTIMNDVVSKIGKPVLTKMFFPGENIAKISPSSIRGLAFFILSSTNKKLYIYTPAIRERLLYLIKLKDESLREEIYILLRVVMIKLSHSLFSPVWLLVLADIFDFFIKSLKQKFSELVIQNIYAGLKFLDQAIAIKLSHLQWHQWSYVYDIRAYDEEGNFVNPAANVGYCPLLLKMKEVLEKHIQEKNEDSSILVPAELECSQQEGISNSASSGTEINCDKLVRKAPNEKRTFPSRETPNDGSIWRSCCDLQEEHLPQKDEYIFKSLYKRCMSFEAPAQKSRKSRLTLYKHRISEITELLESVEELLGKSWNQINDTDSPDVEQILGFILYDMTAE